MPTYLTPRKYSALYDIPESTLANWRSLGTGPAYKKIGRHVRYIVKEEA